MSAERPKGDTVHYSPAQIRKALVAAAGFLITALTAGLGGHLFPASWEPWINAVVGVAAAYGVFAVRNAPAPLDTNPEGA